MVTKELPIQTTLDRTFTALGDPARLNLIEQLAHGPSTVRTLAAPFDISRPAISKHLKVLSDAGVVEHQRLGRENWYSLSPGALDKAEEWMDGIGETWKNALTSLKTLVEEESDGNRQ